MVFLISETCIEDYPNEPLRPQRRRTPSPSFLVRHSAFALELGNLPGSAIQAREVLEQHQRVSRFLWLSGRALGFPNQQDRLTMNERVDFLDEEELERPIKPRKNQEKRPAERYFQDDGVSAARKNAYKQRKQAYQ
jgi:hypothetical protein